MFPIRIGTLIPTHRAHEMLPTLNSLGFESYEMDINAPIDSMDMAEQARIITDLLEGRPVSALGCYGNPLCDKDGSYLPRLIRTMENARLFGCKVIGLFAGRLPDSSVPESIPEFKRVFTELAKRAEDLDLYLAFEGCGGPWDKGSGNIAYCPDAWTLMFDAVPSKRLGLEWEPCHALEWLMDPIPQLRAWVSKVYHVHGKDATVNWDIIRAHGISSPESCVWNRTPGFGDTDWAQVMTILQMNGYEGSVDIEGYHDPAFYNNLEWSGQVRALNYLKDCRGGREFIRVPGYQGYRAD